MSKRNMKPVRRAVKRGRSSAAVVNRADELGIAEFRVRGQTGQRGLAWVRGPETASHVVFRFYAALDDEPS